MHTTATQRTAANVRAELARQQISQAAIGDALGISQQAVSRRLLGRLPITVEELDALANLLGVDAAQLFSAGDQASSSLLADTA